MSTLLIFAIVAMTTALISYSIGVWGEKRAGTIKAQHLGFFWFGLICDTLGTEMMRQIAQNAAQTGAAVPTGFNLHSALGAAALVLMAIHAVWATATYMRNNAKALQSFHRFSLGVWGLWLIPFVSGVVLANMHKVS